MVVEKFLLISNHVLRPLSKIFHYSSDSPGPVQPAFAVLGHLCDGVLGVLDVGGQQGQDVEGLLPQGVSTSFSDLANVS